MDHGFVNVAPIYGGSGYLSSYPYGDYSVYNRTVQTPVIIQQTYDTPTTQYPRRSATFYRSGTSGLESGRSLLKQGEYRRAADALLQAVLADPEAGLPKLLFGHALFAAGDFDYAAYAIRRAVARLPNLDDVSPSMDDLYRNTDEFDRLVYKLHDYLKRHSSEGDAHFLLGYLNYFAGHDNAAIQSFNAALRFDPRDCNATALRKHARARLRIATSQHEDQPTPSKRWIPADKIHP